MIRRSSLYSLIYTLFCDGLGWGVVLTIFAPLLLNPENPLLPKESSTATQNLVLGLLIGCYPLAQFIFMPLIGAISDHLGRKKILEWTTLLAGFSFVLSAIAVSIGSLSLLFASRIFAGIFSANSATAQAAIADFSSEHEKAKNLSLTGVAGGISWIVGPPVGGFLSSKTYFPWADFASPLWFVAILFFLNFLWVWKSFQETYIRAPKPKHDWKQEIKDLSKLSYIPKMKPWLLISFFFYFGWGFYVLFYPALLVTRFHYNQAMIGILSGYSSIFWFASSLALNRGLATRFKPEAFILLGLPITGIFCVVLAHTDSIIWWYVTFPISAIFGSAIWSMTLAVLSNLAGKENQGKVFGVAQSLTALAMFISPMLSGVLASISDAAPLTTSGVLLTLNGVFAALYYFRRPRPT